MLYSFDPIPDDDDDDDDDDDNDDGDDDDGTSQETIDFNSSDTSNIYLLHQELHLWRRKWKIIDKVDSSVLLVKTLEQFNKINIPKFIFFNQNCANHSRYKCHITDYERLWPHIEFLFEITL